MASRPKGYGMTKEIDDKLRAKYSLDDEAEVKGWIEARTEHRMEGQGQDAFRAWLMDGAVLHALIESFGIEQCKYKCSKTSSMKEGAMRNMKESENIEQFLKSAEKLGVKRLDSFQVVNIRDNTNMAQVLSTLKALSSVALSKGVGGPQIGTKIADKNKREFDDKTLNEGRHIIGLQMGTNQVASQKGMTGYGQGRQIIHKTS